MGSIIDDLGVGIMPAASPSLKFVDSEDLFNAEQCASIIFLILNPPYLFSILEKFFQMFIVLFNKENIIYAEQFSWKSFCLSDY